MAPFDGSLNRIRETVADGECNELTDCDWGNDRV